MCRSIYGSHACGHVREPTQSRCRRYHGHQIEDCPHFRSSTEYPPSNTECDACQGARLSQVQQDHGQMSLEYDPTRRALIRRRRRARTHTTPRGYSPFESTMLSNYQYAQPQRLMNDSGMTNTNSNIYYPFTTNVMNFPANGGNSQLIHYRNEQWQHPAHGLHSGPHVHISMGGMQNIIIGGPQISQPFAPSVPNHWSNPVTETSSRVVLPPPPPPPSPTRQRASTTTGPYRPSSGLEHVFGGRSPAAGGHSPAAGGRSPASGGRSSLAAAQSTNRLRTVTFGDDESSATAAATTTDGSSGDNRASRIPRQRGSNRPSQQHQQPHVSSADDDDNSSNDNLNNGEHIFHDVWPSTTELDAMQTGDAFIRVEQRATAGAGAGTGNGTITHIINTELTELPVEDGTHQRPTTTATTIAAATAAINNGSGASTAYEAPLQQPASNQDTAHPTRQSDDMPATWLDEWNHF